jgi:hypothetical protein
MKLGLIFECGPEGPDVKVCIHLLKMLDEKVDYSCKALTNKPGLINDCGKTAKNLIELEKCTKVIVVWDLYPAWRENKVPCRREDREAIAEAMTNAGVKTSQYEMVCIEEELEAWLISDERALRLYLEERIHPHPIGKIKKIKNPDLQRLPKTWLTKLFNHVLGNRIKYVEYTDAVLIVKKIVDLKRVKNSDSFKRFAKKTVGKIL